MGMRLRILSLLVWVILFAGRLPAADPTGPYPPSGEPETDTIPQRLRFSAYGAVNYYAFDWETLPDKRNAFDPERLNAYMYYTFSPKIELKTEVEFEHGGTGVTMDFDPLEEFGEFEQEVEKGGEVVLEQINLLFRFHPWLNLRVGRMRIYTGNAANHDEPAEYFTAYRSEVENTILPLGWYETGLELSGDIPLAKDREFPHLSYKAYLISGLDNSAFNSANWIRRGYQTRFETINADNLACALRLDYVFGDENEIGVTGYLGNTTGNRPKKDFTAPAWVGFGDLHFSMDHFPWRMRAYGMMGYLQNSEALSAANRNLSNNLNVKRTPVGEAAAGAYIEAAYDLLHLFNPKTGQRFYCFSRVEYYDSMFRTQGNVTNNPRYERSVLNLGFNYLPLHNIVFKTHYAWRKLGSGEHENTFTAGMGFDF
ncbi:MAG: autotransporter outer membrane beta-barrel domain-containing protein [Lewinellaceae bacterium]|nr:autotransporter outer membrane beta-barrel domain-containing protein [Lewinellaceae bacterium]